MTVAGPLTYSTTMNEPWSEQQVQLHWGLYQQCHLTHLKNLEVLTQSDKPEQSWMKLSAAGFLYWHRELCPVNTEVQCSGSSGCEGSFQSLHVQHISSTWHNSFCSYQRNLWDFQVSRPILWITSCCFLPPTALYQALYHHQNKRTIRLCLGHLLRLVSVKNVTFSSMIIGGTKLSNCFSNLGLEKNHSSYKCCHNMVNGNKWQIYLCWTFLYTHVHVFI